MAELFEMPFERRADLIGPRNRNRVLDGVYVGTFTNGGNMVCHHYCINVLLCHIACSDCIDMACLDLA